MSEKTGKASSSELSAAAVTDYLRRHPDFLDARPDLLSSLTLSHDTPAGVSSLIEKQVATLRAEVQRYRQQVSRLSRQHEDFRSLAEHTHQLSLKILQSPGAESACDLLHDFVHNDYEADQATLFLFLDRNPFSSTSMVKVLDCHDKLRLLLAELFNRRQPLLDSLQTEYLSLMFGDAAVRVHSTILIPLIGSDWEGLLVVGSEQRDRYRRGPELELLVYLARITAIHLDSWLNARAA